MLTAKLWVTQPSTVKYLRDLPMDADFETNVKDTTVVSNADMTEYGWVCIGTADMDFHLDLTDRTMQAAVASFDLAEQTLRAEYEQKLRALAQAKQEFLALPAPRG